jgi:ferredoxin-NADP reductase
LRDTAFKRVLRDLEPGAEVAVAGPFGDFTLREDGVRPAVFIAGGIGVTPFYAMLKDAVEKRSRCHLYLFYANRRPEDAAYLAELAELARQHPHFTFVPTMTGIEKSAEPWSGETGRVNQEMLEKHVPRESAPRYYLAGPQAMALSMRDMLYERGVSRDDIRYKEFSGY